MAERRYRGIFQCTTGNASWLALDFYAENGALAHAHAVHVASDDAAHAEWGPIRLVKILPISARDWDAGSFRPVAPPTVPIWARTQGRRR